MDIVVGNQNQTIMATSDFPWKVQPQEMKGTYRFSGQFFVTRGVLDALSREEISMIYHITQALVKEFDGLDYILVFKNAETGQTVWFLDALNDEMKPEYEVEHDVCTLCFPEER